MCFESRDIQVLETIENFLIELVNQIKEKLPPPGSQKVEIHTQYFEMKL